MLPYLHNNRFVVGSLVLCLFLISVFYFGHKYFSRYFYAEDSEDTIVPIQSSKKNNLGNTLSQIPKKTMVTAKVPSQIIEKVRSSLVVLEMEVEDRKGKRLIAGSGFFVKRDQIATCLHVIEGATRGTVKLVGAEQKYKIEGVTASDKKHDLAVLKIVDFGLFPLPFGNSNIVQVGEPIYVAGNPNGLEGKVTQGSISSIREGTNDDFLEYLGKRHGIFADKVFQMSAPIQPGSSGGPVLNEKGEVIGISFMTFKGTQALNFSIPSSYLEMLLKQLRPTKPFLQSKQAPSVFTYMSWGDEKFVLNEYEAAIADYNKVIRLEPSFPYAYFSSGFAKFLLGAYEAAIADYDAGLRLQPNLANPYNYRGGAKSGLGQHKAAIADFNKAIRLEPNFSEAYYNRGRDKLILGDHKSALSDFDKAIQLKPDDFLAYSNRGLTKRGLGQYQAAIVDCNEAIRLKPDYAEAYYNRGLVKHDLRSYKSALTDYDTAIRLKPDFVKAYYDRGGAKSSLGFYKSAIADYDEAIKQKTNFADAYHNRGRVKFLLGEFKSAVVDFDEIIRLKPNYADAYHDRGFAKFLLGDFESTIIDLDEAIHLKPAGDATYYLLRGMAKFSLDTYDLALDDFDEAIRLEPGAAVLYFFRGLARSLRDGIIEAELDFQIALKLTKQSDNKNLETIIEQVLQINNKEDLKTFIEQSLHKFFTSEVR